MRSYVNWQDKLNKEKGTFLSLISLDWIHVLIWSLYLWSFLISFFKSASNFSFWFALSVSWTWKGTHVRRDQQGIHSSKYLQPRNRGVTSGHDLFPDAVEDFYAFLDLLQHSVDLPLQLPASSHSEILVQQYVTSVRTSFDQLLLHRKRTQTENGEESRDEDCYCEAERSWKLKQSPAARVGYGLPGPVP